LKKVYIAFFLCSAAAFADSNISELEKALDEATEIATVSKMNVDYVPSVVNVLKGDMLRAVGALKVSDALSLLPGAQIYQNQLGETITVMRGFRNPNAYLSDKIKVMLDGVAVNTEAYGAAGFVMDMPIELIERIEVLRGPGSTMYGSGAFYGAVNIITKTGSNPKDCNEFFIGGGSWYYKKIGGSACIDKGGVRYSADGYYQGSQRRLYVDKSYTDAAENFKRDFRTNEAFDDFSMGFNLKKENLSWNMRIKKSWQGNYYGMEERLEPREDTGHVNQFLSSEVELKNNISSGSVDVKAGIKDYAYQMNGTTRDQSYYFGLFPGFDYNYNYRLRAAETTFYVDVSHKLKKIDKHNISYGIGASHSFLRENYYQSAIEDYAFETMNATLVATQPAMQYPKNNELFKKGVSRTISSLYFEDLYELRTNTDVVFGCRVDDYSDLDAQFSLRAGIASRWINNSFITKFMFSTGHRAPTLAEKYAREHIGFRAGDDFLKPESIRSYEIAAIYKPTDSHSFSINGYYAELNNVIDIEEDGATPIGHTNYPKRLSKGVEAEYSYKPNKKHELHINYTLNKTTYLNTDNMVLQDMPDVSPRMYKAWYIFRPLYNLTLSMQYLIFGKTIQNEAYTNKDTTVPGNHLINLSATYKPLKNTELVLNIGNLQNREQKMPSYYYRNEPARNGGMIREGRNFLLELRHRF